MAVILGDDGGTGDDERTRLGRAPLDRASSDRPTRIPPRWEEVPWRTIIGTVSVAVGAVFVIWLILEAARIITWTVIAGFVAIVLAPSVRWVQARVGGRRAVATSIVMFSSLAALIGMVTLFVMPIRRQMLQVITDLPGTVEDAANGSGPMGEFVTRLRLVSYVREHQDSLQDAVDRLSASAPSIIQDVLSGLLAFVTIFVLAFFFLSQSKALGDFAISAVPHRHRVAVRRVAADAARAVSGYMIGNLIISVFAGVSAFILLLLLGVPNPAVIALWVAFADMLPLIGATIGAIVAVAASFFESTPAGVIALIFFIVYQQIENGMIQPKVMARRVNVNPLAVLLSVLLGVELFGILGALLAIPVAGAIQVAVREVLHERNVAKLVTPDGVDREDLGPPSKEP